ncbi:uncharacterized protein LOC125042390 [Penaeus chinensis]|uniref:uncharacterized protein LOC125042390 n=1 Tax=Penaeus chinensis TaxID=139456 RepID=UPI001FB5F547|nr:uncharacterized protein LOC125042390 [Penaeus chinensis]
MFSILLIAFVVTALGNGEEREGVAFIIGKRIAFLAIAPTEKYIDMDATFHLVSGKDSYKFEFKFRFSDFQFTASVSVNETRQLTSPDSGIECKKLLLEITLLEPQVVLLSLCCPRKLVFWKYLCVQTPKMNSISEMRWKFDNIYRKRLKVMAASVAGEGSSEIILKTGNVEQILNSTITTNVKNSLEIQESLQGEVSPESNGCVSFHFREDSVCDVRRDDDCKVLAEIITKDVAKYGFGQQRWLYLLTLLPVGFIILAYLYPKGYFKPCVPYCLGHRSSSPECEGTHSNSAYSSFEGLQSTDLPRPQEPAFPHGSLPSADRESRESINSDYFRMSDLARSPEAPAAGDCEGDADYSRLQHITRVPVLEGHYDSCL